MLACGGGDHDGHKLLDCCSMVQPDRGAILLVALKNGRDCSAGGSSLLELEIPGRTPGDPIS